MQLGLDVGVGVQGLTSWEYHVRWIYETIRNLSTVMAGARPDNLAVEIESAATNIMSYGFTLPNSDTLFALWTDGAAVDDDPGVRTTLTFPGLSASKVIGIDVLHGFEQELITETGNGNLVIRNLLVKDYPIILRISSTNTNEAGTWTWSAEGDYYWRWTATTPDYAVGWRERARQASTPEASQAISWQFVIGLTAGVVVAGSVIYFFIRTRRKRTSS